MQNEYVAMCPVGPAKMELQKRRLEPLPSGYFRGDVDYCAICGSDRGMWKSGLKACVLGHEFSVTVTDPGDTDLKVGDRVCMYPGIPCWECESCRNGMDNTCSVMFRRGYSGINVDGGFAQKYVGMAKYAFKIPDNVPSQAGALVEPLATAYRAVRRAGIKLGEKVLVIGAGIIGLYCADLAKKAGASIVMISEFNSKRLATAKHLSDFDGYFEASNPELDNNLLAASDGGFDVVFECSASEGGYATTAKVLKPHGKVIWVGQSARPVSIVSQPYVMREISIIPTLAYTMEEYGQTLEMIGRGEVDPCKYVTKIVPLEETQKAFEQLFETKDDDNIKILVKPN